MRAALVITCTLFLALPAFAQQTLPYATRKLSFSGLGTSVEGDIRTVGMGGATVGLADTFIAAIDNPAGLAMTVGVGDIHYATDAIHDGHVQPFDAAPNTDSLGLALGIYPWAFSIGYLSRYREDASYGIQSLLNNPIHLSVFTRQLVISAARVFFHNRLSIGVALTGGQAIRELDSSVLNVNRSFASYTAGVSLGATVQLPKRLLIGASFSAPMHYSGASHSEQQPLAIPGFFQPVEVPWRISLGLGFIPNRFFRADLTLHVFTATPHTALVRDEAALVGQGVTLQPRLGFAYVFADYKELKATLFAGTYFESSRITGSGNRLHGTAGLEARIWIATVGGGLDFADSYRNYLLSIGVDVFGVLARLKVIPRFWTPPSNQMFPKLLAFSDEGLARPLVKSWKPQPTDIDPIKVALAIPKKLGEGFRNAKIEMEKIGNEVAEGIAESNETPEQKRAIAQQAALAQKVEAQRRITAQQVAAQKITEQIQRAEETRQIAEAKQAELKRLETQAKLARKRHHKKHTAKQKN